MKEVKVQVGPDQAWQKLYELREFTRTTGGLHELQIKQLKYWPLVFLEVNSSECSFGFDTKLVIYKVSKFKDKKPKDFKQRLVLLVTATQKLLGDEYEVLVMSDKGKELYRGVPSTIAI